jgi:hypothetical protein
MIKLRVSRYLAERWAGARALGLWNLVFAPLVCAPFIGALLLTGQSVDLTGANVPGTVTIANCESTKGGWNCNGLFTAADGSMKIDAVRLYPYFEQAQPPTGSVVAYVTGPDTSEAASVKEKFAVPLWASLAFALLGLYLLYTIYLRPPRPTRSAEVPVRPTSPAGPHRIRQRQPPSRQ